jgi:hypothetical protein
MKLKDILWLLVIVVITAFVLMPSTKPIFNELTMKYPYIMGFIKTAILASMGEILVSRIKTGRYFSGKGFMMKSIVWGFLGMIFVLIFKVFSSGVIAAQSASLLPSIQQQTFIQTLLTAFLISVIMNLFFAPSFMLLHRITDGYIELGSGTLKGIRQVRLKHVIERIDFQSFIHFVILKTIPFFWIPAHTITFILPETYRVLMAAYLSIALGILLTLAKSRKVVTQDETK